MREMVIYLAGGINGLSDSDCKDWREDIMKRYPKCGFLDPMRRDYRGKEKERYREIVEGDIDDINKCDIFIAYMKQPSIGTSMEIFYSYFELGIKPIIFWDSHEREPSPWLLYHGTVCTDKETWFSLINEEIEKIKHISLYIELLF